MVPRAKRQHLKRLVKSWESGKGEITNINKTGRS